jgi:rRNA-processing protein FCF1
MINKLFLQNKKMEVLIDTSSIIFSFCLKKDIFSNIEDLGFTPVIISSVVEELKKISRRNSKYAVAARYALKVIEERKKEKRIKIIKTKGNADEAIERIAKKKKIRVCTNDTQMKKRIKKLGLEILTVKSNGFVGE